MSKDKTDIDTTVSEEVYLEEIILALQKSFSRVVNDTNAYRLTLPKDAVSMIASSVEFEVTFKGRPDFNEPNHDRLIYDPEGGISMTFRGNIDPGVKEDQEILEEAAVSTTENILEGLKSLEEKESKNEEVEKESEGIDNKENNEKDPEEGKGD